MGSRRSWVEPARVLPEPAETPGWSRRREAREKKAGRKAERPGATAPEGVRHPSTWCLSGSWRRGARQGQRAIGLRLEMAPRQARGLRAQPLPALPPGFLVAWPRRSRRREARPAPREPMPAEPRRPPTARVGVEAGRAMRLRTKWVGRWLRPGCLAEPERPVQPEVRWGPEVRLRRLVRWQGQAVPVAERQAFPELRPRQAKARGAQARSFGQRRLRPKTGSLWPPAKAGRMRSAMPGA